AEGRLDEEHAVDGDRGALVRAGGQAALDPVDPRAAPPPDVGPVDSGECRVVLVAVVAADLGKVAAAGRGARRRPGPGRGGQPDQRSGGGRGQRALQYVAAGNLHGRPPRSTGTAPHTE